MHNYKTKEQEGNLMINAPNRNVLNLEIFVIIILYADVLLKISVLKF